MTDAELLEKYDRQRYVLNTLGTDWRERLPVEWKKFYALFKERYTRGWTI